MAEQEKKLAGAKNKKKKFYSQYSKGILVGKTTYKSKMAWLENNTFNVRAASDHAMFSKLLKNIKNYI